MKAEYSKFKNLVLISIVIITIALSHFCFSRVLLDQFRFPKAFYQIFALIIYGIIFIIFYFKHLNTIFNQPLYYLLYAFFLLSIISYVSADYNPEAHLYFTITFIHIIFFILLTHQLKSKPSSASYLILSMVFISLLVSLYAIVQTLKLDPIFQISSDRLEHMTLSRFLPTGFTGNTNIYSGTIISIIPLLFCITLYSKGKNKIMLFAINIMVLLPLFISMTRGVIIGILITFFYSVYKKDHFKLYITGLFILLLLFGTLIFTIDTNITNRIRSAVTFREEGIQYRLYIYRVTLHMIKENPLFGTGPNSFYRLFTHYRHDYLLNNPHLHENTIFMSLARTFPEQTHNDLLQNISETGIIPNIFLLTFIILILLKKPGENKNKSYDLFIVSIPLYSLINYLKLSIIIFIINSMFNFPFRFATSGLNFILTMSLLCAFIYHSRGSGSHHDNIGSKANSNYTRTKKPDLSF